MTPKVAIVLLNWNGKEDTLTCLASLEALSYPHFEVIIVDNGSTDDSATALQHFTRHVLIETGKNLGFAEGSNVGIKEALRRGADYVLLLNNDTVVDPDLIGQLLKTQESSPHVGIVGATIFLFDDRDTLDHLGGMWESQTATFRMVGSREKQKPEHIQELDYVCGAALLVSKQVFDTIGFFDPRFFLIWEEADFCFRARRHGFKVLSSPSALIWHKVSASFVGGKPHSTYFWWRNRFLWIERNCPLSERMRLLGLVLLPEVAHLVKMRLLKTLQLLFAKAFTSHKDCVQKKRNLEQNRAALRGVIDYVLRRFGNAPAWVYKRGKGRVDF
jgi:GT2 family glycosyltransferase